MLRGETILSGGKVDDHVSEFMVMSSPGGFYIGTVWTACECEECKKYLDGLPLPYSEPNSRETGYFKTKEEAEKALATYKETDSLPEMRY